jgi:hypothetical protein
MFDEKHELLIPKHVDKKKKRRRRRRKEDRPEEF